MDVDPGAFDALKLSGLIVAGAAGGCGDASGEEKTLAESRTERILFASELVTSTTLLDALLA